MGRYNYHRQSIKRRGAKPTWKKTHNEYFEHINRRMDRLPTQKRPKFQQLSSKYQHT